MKTGFLMLYRFFLFKLNLVLKGLFFTACNATNVRSCDNGTPPPLSTEITDCRIMPCNILRGTTVMLDTIFQNYRYTETTRPRAVAFDLEEPIDLPLPQEDGCEGFTNIRCPLDPGDRVRYHFELDVNALYPMTSFALIFSLLDDGEQEIFCFEVDVQLVE
ncbi:ML domain [Popillia japonica]|uniref:ML domain n=1 Tax=Popillia japonica TaxID=7064 RepID=A0AAW1KIK0_POPJA